MAHLNLEYDYHLTLGFMSPRMCSLGFMGRKVFSVAFSIHFQDSEAEEKLQNFIQLLRNKNVAF